MSPASWLGIGAALLSVAFVLALPDIVEVEPADEVEPIEFGPIPAAGLTGADKAVMRKRGDSRGRRAQQSAAAAATPAPNPPPAFFGDDDAGEGDDFDDAAEGEGED